MRLFQILFLLNFIFLSCYSQESRTKKVMSADGFPLADANVYAMKQKIGVFTNENGTFNLDLFSILDERDTLCITRVGYVKQAFTYRQLLQMGSIILKEDTVRLREVTVMGELSKHTSLPIIPLASMPKRLCALGAAFIDGHIYVVGGDETSSYKMGGRYNSSRHYYRHFNTDLLMYDIAADRWSKLAADLSPRAYHTLLLHGQKLIAIGGKKLSTNGVIEWLQSDIDIYDVKHDTLMVDKVNPHQAANAAAFVYGNQLIIMGGSIKESPSGYLTYSDDIHVQNLHTGRWYKIGEMPQPMECRGAIWKQKIYFFGGYDGAPRWNIVSFDLKTCQWKQEGELSKPMAHPAVAVVDDKAYIHENGTMIVYHFLTGQMRSYSTNLELEFSELLTDGKRLYLLGGKNQGADFLMAYSSLFAIDLRAFECTVYE